MNRIKELRKKNKLTQAQLGELVRVDSHVILAWEKERRSPNLTSLKKIANIFHVSLDYIAGNSHEKKNINISNININSNRIKELRTKNNLTQFQLGLNIEIPSNQISKWERCNCDPNIENAIKLANFFDVSLDYLFPTSLSEDGEK